MEIGCGFRTHEIRGHDYVYFWHYEDRGGGSRQIHTYVGAKGAPSTVRRLSGLVEAYYARASAHLARDLVAKRQGLAALR